MSKEYEVHYTVVYRMTVKAATIAEAKSKADYAIKLRNGHRARVFKVLGPDHPERYASNILALNDELSDARLRKRVPVFKNSPPKSIDDL